MFRKNVKLKWMGTLIKIIMILVPCFLFGCQSQNDEERIDGIPVKLEKNSAWSILTPKGEMIYMEEFVTKPSIITNGIFSVEENGGLSLYRVEKKPTLIPNCENLCEAGYCVNDLIPISRPKERISVINTVGETVFVLDPINGVEIVACDPGFVGGKLKITLDNGKQGVLNYDGDIIIEPKYESIILTKKTAICTLNGKNFVLDNEGVELFILDNSYDISNLGWANAIYEYSSWFGMMAVVHNDERGIINEQGKYIKAPSKYTFLAPVNEEFLAVEESNGKWGIVNNRFEVVVRPKYDTILGTTIDGKFIAGNKDNDYKIIDSEGNVIDEIEGHVAIPVVNGNKKGFALIAAYNNSYLFYNNQLQEISKQTFYDVSLKSSSGLITSHYLDVKKLCKQIIQMIKPTGIEDFILGDKTINYILSSDRSEEYADSYNYPIDIKNNLIDPKYETIYGFMSDKPLAIHRDEIYGGGYYVPELYTWNPYSNICGFMLIVKSEDSDLTDVIAILPEMLVANGYSILKQGEASALIDCGNSYICVEKDNTSDSRCVVVTLGLKSFFDVKKIMEAID